MAIKVVTDSTSDLPPEVAQLWDIAVVPLNVHFGDDTYKDGVDISHEEFYRRLTTEAELPKTSQPSIQEFGEVYFDLTSRGYDVISIHLSEKFSGTLNSAWQARRTIEDSTQIDQKDRGRVEIVDSRLASLGLGLVVLEVAKMVRDKATLEQVQQSLPKIISSSSGYVLLETLEYLSKGGRIGKASAFLGSLFSIKPIITIANGEIHPWERVRTRERGIRKLVQVAEESAPVRWAAIGHNASPDEAARLRGELSALVPADQIIVTRFGPVVGTYVGPGALGIGIMSDF